ncbi:response regulator [bacterium]|nr:response regulator [bacterium]
MSADAVMSEPVRSRRVGYGVALAVTGATFGVRLLLWPVLGDAVPHMAFFPAVTLAAYTGGFRPGLLATALGAVAANVVFTEPHYRLGIKSLNAMFALPLFVLVALIISGLCEALHRARRRILADERRRAAEALRRSESRWQSLTETLPQLVWTAGPDGAIDYFSTQCEAYTGLSERALLGWGWMDVVHPADLAPTRAAWAAAADKRAEFEVEHRLRRADGAFRWFKTRGVAAGDGLAQWVGTCTDITTRVEAEGALRRAKDTAEAASRAKDEFLANVSHELRTPMNAVLGMTDLVLEGDLRDDQRQSLRTVRAAADTLMTVLNDLLDFSKIEAGRLVLDPVVFSPRAAVDDVVRMPAPLAAAKGLALRATIDSSLPDALVGDAGRLRQVLLNLIGNAVKFTPSGEVVVRVEAGPGAAGVRFAVQDTGIGIPAELHGRVFRAFEQADTATTRRYGGTGLGLSIADRLVKLMGGTITLDSAPGRGSTFAFTVRFDRPTGTTEPTPVPPPAPAQEPPMPRPLSILVADDNEFNAGLMEQLLARRGHRVRLAGDGRETLALATASGFDLLLLDVHMPELDGFQVVRALRERERTAGGHLPVIALTARARPEDRERCLAAGMDDFLTKPARIPDLLAAIARVTGDSGAGSPDRPGLTPAAILAACENDAALLRKLCGWFQKQMPARAAELAAARQTRDAGRIQATAHKLAGMLSVFSAPAGSLASQAEDLAAAGDLDAAVDLAAQVEAAVPDLLRLTDTLSLRHLHDLAATPGR